MITILYHLDLVTCFVLSFVHVKECRCPIVSFCHAFMQVLCSTYQHRVTGNIATSCNYRTLKLALSLISKFRHAWLSLSHVVPFPIVAQESAT